MSTPMRMALTGTSTPEAAAAMITPVVFVLVVDGVRVKEGVEDKEVLVRNGDTLSPPRVDVVLMEGVLEEETLMVGVLEGVPEGVPEIDGVIEAVGVTEGVIEGVGVPDGVMLLVGVEVAVTV